MFRRQVSKYQKTFFVVLFYLTVYFLLSYALTTTETTITFVSDDFRIGDKYVYMFLVATQAPVFTDADGADVFAGCGRCFITNNKGFMPLSHYDAILFSGWSAEGIANVDPRKRYFFKTNHRCLKNKLRGCTTRPTVTSLVDNSIYDLCSLCETLTKKKLNL